jgi:hypothetical protein
MDERTKTLGTLVALTARRVEHLERALEIVARHVGTDALADELHALAHAGRDDPAASLHWRLTRLARRQR